MIEMLGVLAIIGVLSAGGIMGYSTAMENYRVNKHFSDLKQMAMNARVFVNAPTSGNTAIAPSEQLYQLGITNENYAKQKSVWDTYATFHLYYPQKCNVSAGISNYISGDHPCGFIYTTVFNVSEATCRKLLTFDIKNFFPEFDVFVSTGSYTNELPYTDVPRSPDEATSICAGKQSSSSYIVWRIYWNAKRID